ncbi:hypothetical protein DFO55_11777 [Grimontella sp. AG753]|nr:hypothetical protein DFO55_11777 [Grimontella sp. AG753]
MRALTVPSPLWGEGQDEGENAAREVGSVHRMFMATCHLRTRERVKGNTAFPFTIPAAPQRNRCFALRSPPAPLPAVGLTRVTRPIPGARPSGQRVALFKIVPDDFVLSRQTSVRHPWRSALVIGSSSHRFQRGLNPLAARSAPGRPKMSLWLSCGKTSQPWLKRLKTFTVSTTLHAALHLKEQRSEKDNVGRLIPAGLCHLYAGDRVC